MHQQVSRSTVEVHMFNRIMVSVLSVLLACPSKHIPESILQCIAHNPANLARLSRRRGKRNWVELWVTPSTTRQHTTLAALLLLLLRIIYVLLITCASTPADAITSVAQRYSRNRIICIRLCIYTRRRCDMHRV
jgi:hypothetical protein